MFTLLQIDFDEFEMEFFFVEDHGYALAAGGTEGGVEFEDHCV